MYQELEESLLQLDSEMVSLKTRFDEKCRQYDDLLGAHDHMCYTLRLQEVCNQSHEILLNALQVEVTRLRGDNKRQALEIQQMEGRVLVCEGLVLDLRHRESVLPIETTHLQIENTDLHKGRKRHTHRIVSSSKSEGAPQGISLANSVHPHDGIHDTGTIPSLSPRRPSTYNLSDWKQTYGMTPSTLQKVHIDNDAQESCRCCPKKQGGGRDRVCLLSTGESSAGKGGGGGGALQRIAGAGCSGGEGLTSSEKKNGHVLVEYLSSGGGEGALGRGGDSGEGRGADTKQLPIGTDWADQEQTHPYYPHPPHASSLWQLAVVCGGQEVRGGVGDGVRRGVESAVSVRKPLPLDLALLTMHVLIPVCL